MRKTIIGYIKKKNMPEIDYDLLDLDLFTFAMVSYFKFEALSLWGYKKISLGELAKIYQNNVYKKFDKSKRSAKLVKVVGENDRYKNIVVSNFCYENDATRLMQFGAVMLELPGNRRYISFRGTDESVIGIKEDFVWVYKTNIPSHKKAVEYLDNIIQNDDKYTYILGGHSKGGNLAIYAASKLSKEKQEKIEQVLNFDGPGFSEKFLRTFGYRRILPKCKTYIPKDSVIGLLFRRKESVKIVNSSGISIAQHDPYSWFIQDESFVVLNEYEKGDEIENKTFNEIIDVIPDVDREDFINSICDLMYIQKHETIYDLIKINRIYRSYSLYSKLPKEKREFLRRTFWLFVNAFFTPNKYAKKKKEKKK